MVGLNGLNPPRGFWAEAHVQLATIARLRWWLFVNSLQSTRGQMEVVSRIMIGLVFAVGAVGGAIGLGGAAYFFVSQNKTEWLTLVLWPVFLFWQLFPILATAFTENLDSTNLLRFPLSYPAYFLVRLAYGMFDPATTLGSLWLAGICIGVGYASPPLLLWAGGALLTFAIVNVALSRMIFAWLERWLAQRRTREIMSVVFFLLLLGFQLIAPLSNGHGGISRRKAERLVVQITPLQRALPPGLAAGAITQIQVGRYTTSAAYWSLLCGYVVVILWLMNLRLREEYRGESLSEAAARRAPVGRDHLQRPAWRLGILPGPVAAVFEKELRYLLRSGPMLFTLIVPVFMLVIFRNAGGSGGFLGQRPELAFPMVAGYSLLLLTNLVYNSFGGDGTGVQLFFAAPVEFRQIVLGKNLAHMAMFAAEMLLALSAVCLMYGRPRADALVATVVAIVFAAPVNLAAGNLLSIYFPKRIDYSTFGRQRAAQTTILASFGVQIVVLGTGGLTMLYSLRHGSFWPAAGIFAVLAGIALTGYWMVLQRMDGVVFSRRENLVAELSRAS